MSTLSTASRPPSRSPSPVRVLVVDDSTFFRRRICAMLQHEPRILVVGTAGDGREAVVKTAELDPDVVIMDIEMPVLDGIGAVRAIMAATPKPVLMFSSLTQAGAQATLDALEAGAVDYLPKNFTELAANPEAMARMLCARVIALGRRNLAAPGVSPIGTPREVPAPVVTAKGVRVVAIGCSTGGPVALQCVLRALPERFPLPLLLVQHMPAAFTPAFARRLDQLCAIRVREAVDGEALQPGTALLAPGGRQLLVQSGAQGTCVRIRDGDCREIYRPSVDLTFASLAQAMPGAVLAVVLTGMGSDGREGTRALKGSGARVWAQDERTSVIFGMPGAVIQAGLADRVLALDDIGPLLAELG